MTRSADACKSHILHDVTVRRPLCADTHAYRDYISIQLCIYRKINIIYEEAMFLFERGTWKILSLYIYRQDTPLRLMRTLNR